MAFQVPRVQIVPQPDEQVSFQVDGQERLRWNFALRHPRPFFFPLLGPSGRSVVRMGHPDAPDHGHHRGLWWGHSNVGGVDFWSETGATQQVRQEEWVHYQDGHEEAGMVVRLGWIDSHKVKLMQQELVAVLRPLDSGESWLELQSAFSTPLEQLPLGKTNFGFLGLRVAASMSARYGAGKLTSSDGTTGEKDIFARPARWMDYSGPIFKETVEGVTWFDHPSNLHHPTSWHVRDDGWMSAAFCLQNGHKLEKDRALTLRYGFHVHASALEARTAEARFKEFAEAPELEVVKSPKPWRVTLRRKA
jgi:hypothetical protein